MKDKCCKNCIFFIDKNRLEKVGKCQNWIIEINEFNCHLHGSEVRIFDPEFQFCGDEHWVSIKAKKRNEQLEKLGI